MNLSKKVKIAALVVVSLVLTGCGKVNVGYVDGNKIMTEAPQIQTVIEEGSKKIEEIEAEAQNEFANNPDLSDEELAKAQADVQRKIIGINQAYASQLKYKLDEALADIVKAKNIDVVIDSSETQPLVIEGGIDLTDEVIRKLQ